MGNEERKLTCRQTRCVNNTFCQSLHWQVCTCQRISKRPALTLHTTHCSNPAHNVNKTIIVIRFSFKMTCSTLLATQRTRTLSYTLLTSFHSRRHSRHNTNIRGQTHPWRSLINGQLPFCRTWHTLSKKDGHSTLRTSHSDLAQDVAKELLHGGFTYLFTKFLIILLKVWLICLPTRTSACIFKDTLRNDTHVLLKFRDSIFEICLHLINSNCTSSFLPSLMLSSSAWTSKEIPLHKSGLSLPAILIVLSFSFFEFSYSIKKFIQSRLLKSKRHPILKSIRRILTCSLWNKYPMSPVRSGTTLRTSWTLQKNRTPTRQGCPQFLRLHPRTSDFNHQWQLQRANKAIWIWTAAPNHSTKLERFEPVAQSIWHPGNNGKPYRGWQWQQLQTAVTGAFKTVTDIDAPMNMSTFDNWETSHTTKNDNTFYSDDEPRRIDFLPSTPTPPPPPRKLRRKLSLGMSFPKGAGVLQHVCGACGLLIRSTKDIPGPSTKN